MMLISQENQHLIIYGQSLSTGQQSWPVLSTTNVSGNYMIGSQVWINYNNLSTNVLNPLVANIAAGSSTLEKSRKSQLHAENPIVSTANHIQLKTKGRYNFLATSTGMGGRTIEELSKEYYNPFVYKYFFVNTLDGGNYLMPGITCPAIFWMQGEYNYKPSTLSTGLTLGSKPTTDKNVYKALLIKLMNNMQNDIKSKYKQDYNPLFITYQVGAEFSKGRELAIGMAQLEASNENADIICAGPIYHMPTRGGHRDPNGYRWYGELLGKAYYKTKILGLDFKPLQPLEISRTDEPDLIRIKFLVPQLPLVFDTKLLSPKETHGFEIFVDGVKKAITQVTIEDDQVLIRCANDLAGDVEIVYAGEFNKGQGNLRDSDSYPAITNYIDLDSKDSLGAYIYEREVTETTLRPYYEPRDSSGYIYNKPYPLYNFCVAFYYKLRSDETSLNIPHLKPVTKVDITVPENGATYLATSDLEFSANVSQNEFPITKVEFYINDNLMGESVSPPYSYTLENPVVGEYEVYAISTDSIGKNAMSPVIGIRIIASALPIVSITSPLESSQFNYNSTIEIKADASDTDGTITKVEFFNGDSKIGEVLESPYNFFWEEVKNGDYSIAAKATDNTSQTVTSTPVKIRVRKEGILLSYSEDFEDDLAQDWNPLSGTWKVTSGQYYHSSTSSADISIYDNGTFADYTYTAQSRPSWNNNHGLIFNYVDPDNYYIASFDALPLIAYLIRRKDGEQTILSQAFYKDGGAYVTVTIEVKNDGLTTTIKLNDEVVFDAIPSLDFSYGKIGLYTYYNPVYFDNLNVDARGNVPSTKVQIKAHLNGSEFIAPSSIELSAVVHFNNFPIEKVEFFSNNEKLGESLSPPFSFVWDSIGEGDYEVYSVSIDSLGESVISNKINLKILPSALSRDSFSDLNSSIELYPNPVFTDFIIIKFKNSGAAATLNIYDGLGNLVYTDITRTNKFEIPITSCKKGIHIAKLVLGDKAEFKRFVVGI